MRAMSVALRVAVFIVAGWVLFRARDASIPAKKIYRGKKNTRELSDTLTQSATELAVRLFGHARAQDVEWENCLVCHDVLAPGRTGLSARGYAPWYWTMSDARDGGSDGVAPSFCPTGGRDL